MQPKRVKFCMPVWIINIHSFGISQCKSDKGLFVKKKYEVI